MENEEIAVTEEMKETGAEIIMAHFGKSEGGLSATATAERVYIAMSNLRKHSYSHHTEAPDDLECRPVSIAK